MHRALTWVTELFGSAWAVAAAFVTVAVWAVGGFWWPGGWTDNTYQLFINTGTTVVTFLMVFAIQNTQNRNDRALQTKLDAIAEALENVQDGPLVGLEERSDDDIKDVQEQVRRRT